MKQNVILVQCVYKSLLLKKSVCESVFMSKFSESSAWANISLNLLKMHGNDFAAKSYKKINIGKKINESNYLQKTK